MKKLLNLLCATAFLLVAVFTVGFAGGCSKGSAKEISVCASDVPHAEILNGIVTSELEKKGYKLKVTVLDWTMQNDAERGLRCELLPARTLSRNVCGQNKAFRILQGAL